MIEQKDITIIIPHLGKTNEQQFAIRNCLTSLLETCSCNIIAITNGVDENFQFILEGKPKQLTVMAMEEQGQCKAVNAAAATVNTPWILVTNDDMIYATGWIERLIDQQGINKSLCISPQLVEPRPGAPTFQTKFLGGAGGDFIYEEWKKFGEEYMSFGEGELRTGFNLPFLITKELWDIVGGYDVNYDPWGSNSDSDLEYKIRLAGVQPMQTTQSIVYHFSQTSGTFEPKHQSFWSKNWDYFIEKWGFKRTDERIWEADFVMPDEERIFRPRWEGYFK